MPYCLYVRKSRADAELERQGQGETLARHIQTLLELAKRRNLEIGEIYKEVVSGETISARPQMQRLLSDIEQGVWDGVLVMEVERLARGDTIDQGIVAQAFKYSGTKIITPIKDYDPDNEFDEEYFEFGLFMSRREYKTINRRLQRGRIAATKEGNFLGSIAPFGYVKVWLPDHQGASLTPDPETAHIVQMIFDLYVNGETAPDGSRQPLPLTDVVRRLNQLGIKPRIADEWTVTTVRDVLRNPVYAGKVRWFNRAQVKRVVDGKIVLTRPKHSDNYFEADGKHPPLVTVEMFEAAQRRFGKRQPRVKIDYTLKNPFAGILYCGICGKIMTRRPFPEKEAELICTTYQCPCVAAYQSEIEESVLSTLGDWLSEYGLPAEQIQAEQDEDTIRQKEKAAQKLRDEEKTLQKQLDSLHDLLEQGIYSPEIFLDRSKTVSDKLNANRKQQRALDGDISQAAAKLASQSNFLPKVKHILDVYCDLETGKEKNDLLREVIDHISYYKTVKNHKIYKPGNLSLTVFPKLPKQ